MSFRLVPLLLFACQVPVSMRETTNCQVSSLTTIRATVKKRKVDAECCAFKMDKQLFLLVN